MTKRNALRDDRAGASAPARASSSADPIRRTTPTRISPPAPTSSSSAKASRRSRSCCRRCSTVGGRDDRLAGDSRHRLQGRPTARSVRTPPRAAAAQSRRAAVSRSRRDRHCPHTSPPGASATASAPVSLITARGCPYTCTWCSRSVFGTTHRRRSAANVADEVEAIVDRYHPDRLWYADDVFAIHRGWTLDVRARSWSGAGCGCRSSASRAPSGSTTRWPMRWPSLGCLRVWIGSESGSQRILDAMQRKVTVDQVARRRRRGCGAAASRSACSSCSATTASSMTDLQATVDHLKRTAPDVFLTTVSYPIKGTPYYDAVADRLASPKPWAEGTDRDLVIRGRPSRRYYDFARRWMTGEVARDQHWQRGRYARAARVGVVGARRPARHGRHRALEGAVIVLFNPWSTPSPKKPLPMSLLALGSLLEGEFDYRIVDGNVEPDPVGDDPRASPSGRRSRAIARHGDARSAAARRRAGLPAAEAHAAGRADRLGRLLSVAARRRVPARRDRRYLRPRPGRADARRADARAAPMAARSSAIAGSELSRERRACSTRRRAR